MINEQKFSEASQRDLGRHVEERVSGAFLAFVGGSVVGAICGAAGAWVAHALWAGDEPPIRVKGGSMEIDVLSKTAYWDPHGAKKWKLHGGSRGKDDYDVTVVTPSSSCKSQTVKGNKVDLYYTLADQSECWVEVKSNGNKTEVTDKTADDVIDESKVLKLSTDKRQLYLNVPGHISKIKVGNYEFTFASKDELVHALLMDF